MMNKTIFKKKTMLALIGGANILTILPVITITSCATTSNNQTNNEDKGELDEAQQLKLINTINEWTNKGYWYLVSPFDQARLLNTSEEFINITKDNVKRLLKTNPNNQADWAKMANLKGLEINDFNNNKSLITFKIKLNENVSDEIKLVNPIILFRQQVASSPLIQPTNRLALGSQSAISSGKTNATTIEQVGAIVSYIKNQWALTKLDKVNDYEYRFAISQNTNTIFNRVFNKIWTDVFKIDDRYQANPLWAQLNRDFANVNQVVVDFKIKELVGDHQPNGLAQFRIELQYVQFSWKKDYFVSWLLPNETSYRYLLNDTNVAVITKNVTNSAGAIVKK